MTTKVRILNDAEGECVYVQVGDILIRTYQAYAGERGKPKKCGVYVNVGYGAIEDYAKEIHGDEKPWVLSSNWDLKETVDAVLGQPGYDPND